MIMHRGPVVWTIVISLTAAAWAAQGESQKGKDDAAGGRLLRSLQGIQERELGDLYRSNAAREKIEEAGVELGRWHRIGPLRDQPPLLNWMENVASSFAHVFEAERDFHTNGGTPLLEKTYPAPNFPATPDASRRWMVHPEWIDGYLCDLPRGPAPSAGETQYVYRRITAKRPVVVEMDFAVRSPESDRRQDDPNMEHWRRQARYACWINGKQLLSYDGKDPIPGTTKLELNAGVNHFLAKVTNNRHAYGFSFAIVGLHPAPRRPGPHEQPWRPFQSYGPGDLPYCRAAENAVLRAPGTKWQSVRGANWRDALFASTQRHRTRPDGPIEPDVVIADFEGSDYGDWKVTGEAFGPGPARGTLPPQMEVTDFQGKGLVNTYFKGDGTTGTLTSPPIRIERPFVNFLIGGGGHKGKTCINLLVEGKVVRTAAGPNTVPGGHEKLQWRSWDVGQFVGQQAVLQIVDNFTGGWGHINIDQITASSRKINLIPQKPEVWTALQQEFTDAKSRFEIELTRSIGGIFWDRYLSSTDRTEAERALADFYLTQHAAIAGKSPPQILEMLGIALDAQGYADEVRSAYFTACRYHESLVRLKSFRHVHTPMPGIEAARRDAQGRIITPMDASLQRYPESASGRRHRLRVQTLGSEIESLLKTLVRTGQPRLAEVLDLDDRIEQMWAEEIRALPPIIFLQRPSYRYDALQFTLDGAAPASVRVFDPARGKLRTVFHDPQLRAHDMTLSWDAQTVLIGGGGNVAEVGVDGNGYRVITRGQSPTEMPNGRIIFFDDVEGISPCKGGGPRRLLFTTDRDGSRRQVVSANLTIDTTPQILDDGRVVFCRWDYGVNKNVFNRHGIWVQNPDGTAMDLFFGNTIIDPFAFYRPRQIPGRPELVCTLGTHHNHNAGLVGLIWQGAGREAGDGVGFERITHDTASVGDACPHWAYQDPYPLNEQLFLVSYGGTQERNMAIYLLDRFGNKKCVFEPTDDLGAFCPQPFVPRARPPRIPELADNPIWQPVDLHEQLLTDPNWSQKAVLTVQDVYRGIEPEVQRGRVKHLAVMEQVVHTTPRGGAIGVGTIFYVNRLVGLVPVEKDGSAHFEVPALRSLYLHVLDADGKMLMTMGSDMHAMPGEHRSCIGCHESRKTAAAPAAAYTPLALGKPPVRPKMPDWGTNGILEYEAVVQPVFDKYCVECHSGPTPDGRLDLSGSRTTVYNMSYMELVDKALVHFVPGTGRTHAQPSNDYDEQAPLSRGTLLSKITAYIEDPKHSKATIPWEDRYRIYCWIDANVPFYSHYTQMSPTILTDQAFQQLHSVYQGRCASCHDQRPRKDAVTWLSRYNTWVHAGPRPGQWGIAESGMRVRHLNLSHPKYSRALQAPLAKSAGGLQLCVSKEGEPVFDDKDDPDYRRIIEALADGVVFRNQPGVWELLNER